MVMVSEKNDSHEEAVAGGGVRVEERVIRRGNQGSALSWRNTAFGARTEGLLGTLGVLSYSGDERKAVFTMTASSAKIERRHGT